MGNWGLLHRYKWSETHPFNRTVSFRPILRLTFFVVLSCLVAPFWGIVKQIDCGSHQHVQDFYVSLHVFFLLPMDIDMIYNDTHTHTHIYIYTVRPHSTYITTSASYSVGHKDLYCWIRMNSCSYYLFCKSFCDVTFPPVYSILLYPGSKLVT